MTSRVPQDLRAGITALMILLGTGAGGLVVHEIEAKQHPQRECEQAPAEGGNPLGKNYSGTGVNRPNSSFGCDRLRVFGGHVAASS